MTTVHPPPPASRRPPPPCWSNDETVALIHAYRDKWYSLRRSNLRAPDWQDVAATVAVRCHLDPPKTTVQCRHKMEKLKQRYRNEVQRVRNPNNPNRFNKVNNKRLLDKCLSSNWVHFKLMDDMECGVTSSYRSVYRSEPSDRTSDQEHDEEDLYNEEGEDAFCLYPKGIKQAVALGYQGSVCYGTGIGCGSGVRIRVPAISDRKVLFEYDDLPPGVMGRGRSGGVMSEMVAAVERLGDGFVKMERMKMDMVRELEVMRMKMERKRMEMIVETQRKMWDSVVTRVMERESKKVKRVVTLAPEC